METKVKTIERVEQGKKMVDVTHSCNINCSTMNIILKNKDKVTEHVKSNLPMMCTIISKKHGKVIDKNGEIYQFVDIGSALVSSSAQLNVDSVSSVQSLSRVRLFATP